MSSVHQADHYPAVTQGCTTVWLEKGSF